MITGVFVESGTHRAQNRPSSRRQEGTATARLPGKPFLFVLGAGLLAASLISYHKAKTTAPGPEQTQASVAQAPAAAALTPLSIPDANHLAPPGVFFLVSAASVVTDDGVTGLRPGTRAVRISDGKFIAEGLTVSLRSDQITNDLRIAAKAAGADQATQEAIRQLQQVHAVASKAAATPPPGEQPKVLANFVAPPPAPAAPPRANPLDAPARKVKGLNNGTIY